MYGIANVRHGGPRRRYVVWLALACAVALPPAWAVDIEQGVLLLRWGDARPAMPAQATPPPRFKAWLDAGPGARRRLDVA